MKRVCSLLLAMVMLLSLIPSAAVSAASATSKTVTYTVSTFKTKSLKKNDTFTVKVSTSSVSSIACVEFKLAYDKTKFSVVSSATAGYLRNFDYNDALTPVAPMTDNGEVWITGMSFKGYTSTKSQTIATITFKALTAVTADSSMFAVETPIAMSSNLTQYKTSVVDGGLYVYRKAAIKTQSKSAAVAKGKTAKVSVVATGDGLKYQWYVKEPGAKSFKAISGATKASYSFTMKAAYSGRSFYCSVKGAAGNTVKSKTAVIDQKVTITTQPKAGVFAKGKSASVTVSAVGGGLKYKWYVKEPGAKAYKAISSATKATYKFTMANKYAGRSLYCVVTDKYGNSVKSKAVVVDQKVTIATQPKSVTVAKNKTAKVTVSAVGAGLKYKWYVKEAGAKSFKAVSTKTATYSAKMTAKNSGRQVYCVITDKYGNKVQTKTVTLKAK